MSIDLVLLTKALSKKKVLNAVWRFLRWLFDKVQPELFAIIRDAIERAEGSGLPGNKKREAVWEAIKAQWQKWEDDQWFINIAIEFIVGELARQSAVNPRYLELLKK